MGNKSDNNVDHFSQNHTAIAKLLIEKGAKLDEKSYVSTTAGNGDVDIYLRNSNAGLGKCSF